MIPYLLAAVGGYLLGDSMKESEKFADGGSVGEAWRYLVIDAVNVELKDNQIKGRLLNEKQSEELQKEIESKYSKDSSDIFSKDVDDIRMSLANYTSPVYWKIINGIDIRIATGLIREMPEGGRKRAILIYADGKILGEFYSLNDAKQAVTYLEKNLDAYFLGETFAKGGKIEVGNKYGDWSITQIIPLKYNDDGSIEGGVIKLVNQDTLDDVYIRNSNDLRGDYWYVSYKKSRIEDKKLKVVLDKFIKIASKKMSRGGKTKGIEARGDCYYIAGQFAMDNIFTPKNINYIGTPYLVHGEEQGQGAISHIRYGHAWIEDDENVYDFSNGRELVIPKVIYYAIGDIKTENPKKYRKYTFAEARRKMLDTGHYGCWDLDVKYADGGITI